MKRKSLLMLSAVCLTACSVVSCSESEETANFVDFIQIHSQTGVYQSTEGVKEGMWLRSLYGGNIICASPQLIEGFSYVKGYEYLLDAEKVVDYHLHGYEYHAYVLKGVRMKGSNWDVKTDCIVDGELISDGQQSSYSSHIAPDDNMFCALHELSDHSSLTVIQNDNELATTSKFTQTEDSSTIGKYQKYISSSNPLKGERWDLNLKGNQLHYDVVIAQGNDATDTVIYLFEDRTEALQGDDSSIEQVLIRETLTHHSKSIYDWEF
mgnify:CR=1 FL=1